MTSLPPLLAWFTTEPNPEYYVYHVCLCCPHNDRIQLDTLEISTWEEMSVYWRLYCVRMNLGEQGLKPERRLCEDCIELLAKGNDFCNPTSSDEEVEETIEFGRPLECL